MIKMNIDSISAVKITENEGRVNAQMSEVSHVSQSVANQKLPDTLHPRQESKDGDQRDPAHTYGQGP